MSLTEQLLSEFSRLPEPLQRQALTYVRSLQELDAAMDDLIAENLEALEELAK